ncbi:MAG: (d)CMP kinase [Rikenellaceae bacterium]
MRDRGKIIAIDGYSSCGKSTFAKMIAKSLGYVFIDTGAMYRAVTLYSLENNLSDEELLTELDLINIEFRFNESLGRSEIYLMGRNADSDIRSQRVNENVSRVAALSAVRRKLVDMQRAIGSRGGVVMDGRDIGTVVFPNADIKLFMTADVMVRAERRFKEMNGSVSLEEVAQNIAQRDYDDENRADSPLRKAADAIVMDNSHLTLDEQMEIFSEILSKA